MEETRLLLDVSVALGIALAGGWLASRLRLSAIVGYVVAGIIISPFTPGFVGDVDRLRVIADVGIVLLLFGIGVQFSFADLSRVGPGVALASTVQVGLVMAVAAALGAALGWSRDEALYAGAAASISSGVVLVRLLEDRGDIASAHGRIAVAWSVMQDMWAILLIVGLAALGDSGGDGLEVARDVGLAAIKAAAFIAVVVVVGLRAVPWVLYRVAEERSRELFFLAIAALAMGTALASEWAGLSLALGAFLAGIIVSESDLSHRVLGELLPARDVFAVLFFTTAGMLIDPEVLADEWRAIALLLLCMVALKPIVSWALMRPARTGPTAALTAAALVAAGEFSFVLARSGLDRGAISEDVFGVILAATVASILLSPGGLSAAYAFAAREGHAAIEARARERPPSRLGRRAVVAGFNDIGRVVAAVLGARFEVTVLEDDPRLARAARREGYAVVEGHPTSPATVERLQFQEARVLIIALLDAFTTRLLTERAREVNPRLDVAAAAISRPEAERLGRSGVTRAVVAEREAAYELARYGLHRFGVSAQEALAIIQRLREGA